MPRGEIKTSNQPKRLEGIAFRCDLVNWQVDKELDKFGSLVGPPFQLLPK